MSVVTTHRLALTVALAAVATGCAVNRPHVKSLRDREAHDVRFDGPIPTTIEALNAIPSHCGPAPDHRVRPEEFQVYQVLGRITRVKRERDHDIHVVLEDPDDPREHLVAESEDPNFRGNAVSPYRAKLEAARNMFEELRRQSGARELEDLRGVTVRVTGVGFFDLNHLQVGRSRSCIELHPILAIERISEYSEARTFSAPVDSSPVLILPHQSALRGFATRSSLMGLLVLRHIGFGPHVHPTPPDVLVASHVAQLWTEPSDLASRDLFAGAWGLQAAPRWNDGYSLVGEKKTGFSPGYDLKGPDGTEWSVKMGPEAQTEVVASRILWAVGYHQPPVYYLPKWMLLRGTSSSVQGPARFRRKIKVLSAKGTWSWQQNPFVATQAYRGLLVLMMMLNSTDLRNDNNTVYELAKEREGARQWYVVRDLGATFGETGLYRPRRNYLTGFERAGFIKGVDHGFVRFEFHGLQQELIRHIAPTDVRWMCDLLGRLSPGQWRDAFRAAGYPSDIADRYIAKLHEKIQAGKRLVVAGS